MTSETRNHGKRTGYCTESESFTLVGSCDVPTCDGPARKITPEGYVCDACASAVTAEYGRVRDRDLEAAGER